MQRLRSRTQRPGLQQQGGGSLHQGPPAPVRAPLPHPTPALQDKESGELVTFCTGVRAGDTLMPMWCGTDYENEKSRSCSSYFNMLYEVRSRPLSWWGAGGVHLKAALQQPSSSPTAVLPTVCAPRCST